MSPGGRAGQCGLLLYEVQVGRGLGGDRGTFLMYTEIAPFTYLLETYFISEKVEIE